MATDLTQHTFGKAERAHYAAVVNYVEGLNNPEMNRAIAAGLLNKVNLNAGGERISDPFAAEQGLKTKPLDVSMYGRTAAGSTVAVTYTCQDTGEVYMLMARKYADPKNPEAGLGQFIMPGGYMNPKPPVGAEGNIAYDENLAKTALRELQEETGMKLPEGYMPKSLGTDSSMAGNSVVHTINEFFHIPIVGTKAEMDKLNIAAKDDIASVEWINLKQIAVNPSIGEQPDGSNLSRYSVITENGIVNLRDLHGVYLEKAAIEVNNALAQQQPALTPSNDNKWQQMVTQQQQQKMAQQTVMSV